MNEKPKDDVIEKLKSMIRDDMTADELEKAGEFFESLKERNAKNKMDKESD